MTARLLRARQRARLLHAWQRGSLQSCAGLLLLGLLLLPQARQALEASMTLHMLAQYPALMLAGALLVGPVPRHWQRGIQRCNQHGISGLLFAALVMAVLMVPRVLDLALVELRVENFKLVALAASGAALRLSWRRAGTVVQAFFLGNLLPMLAVAGTLYQDSPARVCNAYLLGDQQRLGTALVGLAAAIGALWLLRLALGGPPVRQRTDMTATPLSQ